MGPTVAALDCDHKCLRNDIICSSTATAGGAACVAATLGLGTPACMAAMAAAASGCAATSFACLYDCHHGGRRLKATDTTHVTETPLLPFVLRLDYSGNTTRRQGVLCCHSLHGVEECVKVVVVVDEPHDQSFGGNPEADMGYLKNAVGKFEENFNKKKTHLPPITIESPRWLEGGHALLGEAVFKKEEISGDISCDARHRIRELAVKLAQVEGHGMAFGHEDNEPNCSAKVPTEQVLFS